MIDSLSLVYFAHGGCCMDYTSIYIQVSKTPRLAVGCMLVLLIHV